LRLEKFEQLLIGRIGIRRELAHSFPNLVSDSELDGFLRELDRMIDFFVEAGSQEARVGPAGMAAAQAARSAGDCFRQLARLELDVLKAELALPRPRKTRGPADKPVKRSARYPEIVRTLQEIALSNPKDHREVFRALDGRVSVPDAQPFLSAKGWVAGFKANPKTARAWLSRAWSRQHLPAFRRGPK
jgi:hypothetical protein